MKIDKLKDWAAYSPKWDETTKNSTMLEQVREDKKANIWTIVFNNYEIYYNLK